MAKALGESIETEHEPGLSLLAEVSTRPYSSLMDLNSESKARLVYL